MIFLVVGLSVGANNPILNYSVENPERVLVYATPFEVNSYEGFSIWRSESFLNRLWISATNAGLYARNSTKHWVPDLASGYPLITGNSTEYTVSLRTDAKFPDGTPISADDVIFSYKVLLSPSINRISYWQFTQFFDNSSFVKIDNTTVKFILNKPYVFALSLLSEPIVEKKTFQSQYDACDSGDQNACFWEDYNGTYAQGAGPFMVDFIDLQNNIISLVKNPNYWNQSLTDRIVIKTIYNRLEALNQLKTGEVDLLDPYYMFPLSEVENTTNIKLLKANSPVHQEISLNHKSPYWGNGSAVPDGNHSDDAMDALLIRRAMSHIVDRQNIVDQILGGLGMPAASTMPASSFGWDPNLKADEYNITLARDLMTQAGFNYSNLIDSNGDGVYETFFFNVTVLSPNTNPARNQWVADFVQELPKIGIGVKQHISTGWGNIISRTFGASNPPGLYDEGGYDIFFVGYSWSIDWDPSGLYEESSFLPSGWNFYNYVNHTLENLISNYLSSNNQTEIIKNAHVVQKAIHDDLPVIPLIFTKSLLVMNSNVSGIDADLFVVLKLQWNKIVGIEREHTVTSTGSTMTTEPSTPSTTPTSSSSFTTTETNTMTTSSSSQMSSSKKTTRQSSITTPNTSSTVEETDTTSLNSTSIGSSQLNETKSVFSSPSLTGSETIIGMVVIGLFSLVLTRKRKIKT